MARGCVASSVVVEDQNNIRSLVLYVGVGVETGPRERGI